MQVLRTLIAHAGSVVTRAQLIALLWPKTVVDFDAGLNTVIRKLRSALGDTSETPRYIETLPRRGYRFVGVLEPEPDSNVAALADSPTVPVSAATGASPPVFEPASPDKSTTLPEAAAFGEQLTLNRYDADAQYQVDAQYEALPSTVIPASGQNLRFSVARSVIATLAVLALLTGGAYVLWRARSGADVASVRMQPLAPSRHPIGVAPINTVAFNPPPHSVAVLPFVNLSAMPLRHK